MKKTILIAAATVITLSVTFAFKTKSEITPVVKEEKVATTNNGGGFALQDQDQWK